MFIGAGAVGRGGGAPTATFIPPGAPWNWRREVEILLADKGKEGERSALAAIGKEEEGMVSGLAPAMVVLVASLESPGMEDTG